ncbi:MAG: protein-glutamate O-methyltransferase [Hydrogenovibrio crunogenus]|nr:protein-glutamate O-methyltransferase [Hydrogenovibrio crunogenus]
MIHTLSPRLFAPQRAQTAPEQAAPAPSTEVGSEAGQRAPVDGGRVNPQAAAEGPEGEVLTSKEQREVERLKKRDAEVRAHEQAHAASGGAHAGAPSYGYETGPDGKRYAVSGEVSIDTSEIEGDTRGSLQKLEQVARAAMAPAQPSGQDRKVAAQARAKIARLRAEMVEEKASTAEAEESGDPAASRAAGAYQKASTPEVPTATLDITACGDCGQGHSR